jgi:hypothetical protein
MNTLYTDPERFLAAARSCLPRHAGVPRGVFLVSPAGFRLAEESARDNAYMRMGAGVDPVRALAQHEHLAAALARAGIPAIVFPGDPSTPDAVFPNNVHASASGRVVVGSMRHPVRRREAARGDIRAFFTDVLGYHCIDLSLLPCVAELTGSLVIDRARNIGFCGLSERCDAAGATAMAEAFGLDHTLVFQLAQGEYHSNVVMSALAGRGVLYCAEGFADPSVPACLDALYGEHTIRIGPAEKTAFAGNCIALGERGLWMSRHAAQALSATTREAIAGLGFELHAVELSELEKAGGSLRCMIGEIY